MEQGDEGSPGPKVQKVREPKHSKAKPATVPCCAVAYGVQLHGGEPQQAIYVSKRVTVQRCAVASGARLAHTHRGA